MKKKILLSSSLILLNLGFAQINQQDLDEKLIKIQKKSNLPGFAVAIVKQDSVLFTKGFGFADKNKKTLYTTQTIQPIGSVSKTFIGFAVMKSIDLGYFDLETNINDVLPFKISNPNFPNENIKIKHLVTHTSSLIDNEKTYYNVAYQLKNKPTTALNTFIKDYYEADGKYYKKENFSTFAVGSTYEYSNIASALMAYVIEYKSGMLFSEFTSKYIFEPLKMQSTSWFYNEKLATKYATLYMVNDPEVALEKQLLNPNKSLKTYSCVTYPDGSLKTTVADLSLYLKAMIQGFDGKDSMLLTSKSFQTLFKSQFNEATMPLQMDKREPNRAVFWAFSKKGDLRHTGSDPGVFALISFNPTTKIGLVMTINTALDGGENIKTIGYFKQIMAAINEFDH